MGIVVEYFFKPEQLKYEDTIGFIIQWLEDNVSNADTLKIEVIRGNIRAMGLTIHIL